MKVLVFSYFPLPSGLAPTTRMVAYGKGMVMNGVNVDLLSIYPYSKKESNSNWPEDLKFVSPFSAKYSRFILIRAIHFFLGLVFSLVYLKNNSKKYDSIIISNDNPFILGPVSFFSKILGIPVFFIFDEFPIPIRYYLKSDISLIKKKSYRLIFRFVDGFISMTDKLLEFYSNFLNRPMPQLLLNTITDTDRFLDSSQNNREDSLCYMGNMELSKDNVDLIIKAFAKVILKFPTFKLKLFGKPNQAEKRLLEGIISELDLGDKVSFHFANYDEVPSVLSKSTILVSSQPNTVRATGGFPTKVGEYLASGTPIITTDVGEISKFVKDGEHLFLVEPENINSYANKIEYVLKNYPFALEVAKKGRELLNREYSHLIAGEKIINFINKVNDTKTK